MPKINLEQMIQGYSQMTPEQINFLKWFYSNFDNNAGVHKTILNVEPFFYFGVTGGSEFTIYAATKLYICLKMIVSPTPANVPNAAPNGITLYNESNVASGHLHKVTAVWKTDTLTYMYMHDVAKTENIYFSRIGTGQYAFIYFNGFRVTLN